MTDDSLAELADLLAEAETMVCGVKPRPSTLDALFGSDAALTYVPPPRSSWKTSDPPPPPPGFLVSQWAAQMATLKAECATLSFPEITRAIEHAQAELLTQAKLRFMNTAESSERCAELLAFLRGGWRDHLGANGGNAAATIEHAKALLAAARGRSLPQTIVRSIVGADKHMFVDPAVYRREQAAYFAARGDTPLTYKDLATQWGRIEFLRALQPLTKIPPLKGRVGTIKFSGRQLLFGAADGSVYSIGISNQALDPADGRYAFKDIPNIFIEKEWPRREGTIRFKFNKVNYVIVAGKAVPSS